MAASGTEKRQPPIRSVDYVVTLMNPEGEHQEAVILDYDPRRAAKAAELQVNLAQPEEGPEWRAIYVTLTLKVIGRCNKCSSHLMETDAVHRGGICEACKR